MGDASATRGHGILEGFLAQARVARAERLMRGARREGRLLDIGCGAFPLLLAAAAFRKKCGLDQSVDHAVLTDVRLRGCSLVTHDLGRGTALPFGDAVFHVVTSLAVIEHIEERCVVAILREAHRVLAPGGIVILTTPARWTDPILRILARLGLVSKVEIAEHVNAFTRSDVRALLAEGGFAPERTTTGCFECCLNIWACAVK